MPVGMRVDIPHNITRTTICIDALRRGEIYGRCYNPYHHAPPEFVGLSALIRRMEALFDRTAFPQRTLEPRGFLSAKHKRIEIRREGVKPMTEGKVDLEKVPRGEKATFVVNVQFRQNATWQGTVSWSEQRETRHFRSMLELITLMNDALATDDTLANWEQNPLNETIEEIQV